MILTLINVCMCVICFVCTRHIRRTRTRERERNDKVYLSRGEALHLVQEVIALRARVDGLQNKVVIVAPSRN